MKVDLHEVENVKKFVRIAERYKSTILLQHWHYQVDGTSLLGCFSLNLSEPVEIHVLSDDEDEKFRFYDELRQNGLKLIED